MKAWSNSGCQIKQIELIQSRELSTESVATSGLTSHMSAVLYDTNDDGSADAMTLQERQQPLLHVCTPCLLS